MPTVLERDIDLRLPDVTIVTASAGSGKTYTLTLRFVQLLLSEAIPHNGLKNILAITFTNNAAAEMRERVMDMLKKISLGDEKALGEIAALVALGPAELQAKATLLVDAILAHYADFQIKTIDSFMTSVFKSSSVEFGITPDFAVALDHGQIVDAAFEAFTRTLGDRREDILLLERLVDLIAASREGKSAYLWNPYRGIATRMKDLSGRLGSLTALPLEYDYAAEMDRLREAIGRDAETLETLARRSGFERKKFFDEYIAFARRGEIESLSRRKYPDPPLKKGGVRNVDLMRFNAVLEEMEPHSTRLGGLLAEHIRLGAAMFHQPVIRALALLEGAMNAVQRQEGELPLDDVCRRIVGYLATGAVPEVYLKLGETIYHYLIDEFQDTSPVQWAALRMLIENSLAQGGSLFIVGDTKQSIYGFRGADWTIMTRLMASNEFPAAATRVVSLPLNHRSDGKLVEFTRDVFHTVVPAAGFAEEARASGLSTFEQSPLPKKATSGYVEVVRLGKDAATPPERKKLLDIIEDCVERGYRWRDIAILTPANKDVLQVSGWLNENGIHFISHSSLDIRRRKAVGEVIALLRFLDSPVDDLAFTTFLFGDVFRACTEASGRAMSREETARLFADEQLRGRRARPYYKIVHDCFPALWLERFEELLALAGYLPLYDLLTAVYKTFDILPVFRQEEAAFIKLMEVIKAFEEEGSNSLKEFLAFAGEESGAAGWELEAPRDADAIQVLTVHKAKGLGYRVVIVLLYDKKPRMSDYYIEEEEGGVKVLRIRKDMAERVPELGATYTEQKFRNTVDDLNALYVSLTRAKEELYVVALSGETPGVPSTLLPPTGYEPGARPAVAPTAAAPGRTLPHMHHSVQLPPALTYRTLPGIAETRRGDLIHAVLAGIEYFDDAACAALPLLIERAAAEERAAFSGEKIAETLLAFFNGSGILPYFAPLPGRRILREQELAGMQGALYRADRIVVDGAGITVIDFKTGSDENEDAYILQLRNYRNLVQEIFCMDNIVTLLAYVDLCTIKEVR